MSRIALQEAVANNDLESAKSAARGCFGNAREVGVSSLDPRMQILSGFFYPLSSSLDDARRALTAAEELGPEIRRIRDSRSGPDSKV